jgi:hypothetical protein
MVVFARPPDSTSVMGRHRYDRDAFKSKTADLLPSLPDPGGVVTISETGADTRPQCSRQRSEHGLHNGTGFCAPKRSRLIDGPSEASLAENSKASKGQLVTTCVNRQEGLSLRDRHERPVWNEPGFETMPVGERFWPVLRCPYPDPWPGSLDTASQTHLTSDQTIALPSALSLRTGGFAACSNTYQRGHSYPGSWYQSCSSVLCNILPAVDLFQS